MKPKRSRLHSLDPVEVSLVTKGANRKKYLIAKSAKGTAMPAASSIRELIAKVQSVDPKVARAINSAVAQRAESRVQRIAKDAGESGEIDPSDGLSEGAQAALQAVGRLIAPYKDELTDADMDALQEEIGMLGGSDDDEGEDPDADGEDEELPDEVAMAAPGHDDAWMNDPDDDEATAEDGIGAPDGDSEPSTDEGADNAGKKTIYPKTLHKPGGVTDEHHQAAMKAAAKAYEGALDTMGYKIEKAAESDDDDEDEEEDEAMTTGKKKKITKSAALSAFAPEQREQLTAIFKAHTDAVVAGATKELVQKVSSLEKELEVEREDRLNRQFVAKSAEYKNLGVDVEQMSKVLKAAHKTGNQDLVDQMEAILKAADAQLETAQSFGGNLYGEMGSKLPNVGAGSAEGKLQALVDSVVQKSAEEGGGRSRAQIYRDVLKSNEGRKLYRESQRQ